MLTHRFEYLWPATESLDSGPARVDLWPLAYPREVDQRPLVVIEREDGAIASAHSAKHSASRAASLWPSPHSFRSSATNPSRTSGFASKLRQLVGSEDGITAS